MSTKMKQWSFVVPGIREGDIYLKRPAGNPDPETWEIKRAGFTSGELFSASRDTEFINLGPLIEPERWKAVGSGFATSRDPESGQPYIDEEKVGHLIERMQGKQPRWCTCNVIQPEEIVAHIDYETAPPRYTYIHTRCGRPTWDSSCSRGEVK